MNLSYKSTLAACYTGYVVQAVVNNFVPLLFLTFQDTYGISLSRITILITVNFLTQLIVDMLSAGFVDRAGYRASAVAAHAFAFAGLAGLAFLPDVTADPFAGLLISVVVYAVGGGLLEVLISPIVEALPTKNKEKSMSMLHSFYCWGHVAVVLLSTLFFLVFGIDNWKILALLWALVPAANLVVFTKVPLYPLVSEDEEGIPLTGLIKRPVFWIFLVVMTCAGASEQAVSQWASSFAEQGLGVSKTIGDLAGPMLFAVCMGTSRFLYGLYGDKIALKKAMSGSALLCIASYFVISLSPAAALSLIGCGICGFSVGIMWPGTFSMAAASLKDGGTAMFAFFALAGDLGCSGGPSFVGMLSESSGKGLSFGILCSVVFPAVLLIGILLSDAAPLKKRRQAEKTA